MVEVAGLLCGGGVGGGCEIYSLVNTCVILFSLYAIPTLIQGDLSVSNIPFLTKYIPDTYPIFFSIHTLYIPYIKKNTYPYGFWTREGSFPSPNEA